MFWYTLGSPKQPIGKIMKYLLIILSILLLNSPLFGQSEKPHQVNSVGTSPLPWLSGVINGSYERRIKPEIGLETCVTGKT